MSYGVVNSVFFGTYGTVLKYLKSNDPGRQSTYKEIYVAGCVGGFTQLFVACPVDVVKVVLQSQMSRTAGKLCPKFSDISYFGASDSFQITATISIRMVCICMCYVYFQDMLLVICCHMIKGYGKSESCSYILNFQTV